MVISMLHNAAVSFISMIGILIPASGILALFHKEQQNKVSTYLMFTNIGCLVMNCGYLLFLRSKVYEETMLALRIEYLGNALFYFFFFLFLVSYFHIRFPRLVIYMWAAFQSVELVSAWIENLNRFLIGRAFFRIQENVSIYSIRLETGIIHIIRYSFISNLLLYGLIYTIIRMIRTKIPSERNNLARLTCAQFVVLLSLVLMQLYNFPYDFVPILSSLSILSIILSVIRGEFFSIKDMGHEWVFDQMEDAFVIVDSMYGYLNANAYAKTLFPELGRNKIKNKRIPDKLYQVFTEEKEEQEIDGKYYERKITAIEQDGKVVGYSLLLVDITKQHHLVEELKYEKQKAEDANQAKSEFLSNMSHDIRTPMNAIVGFATLLQRDAEKPDKVREYTRKITFSSQHLLNLINDILDMSKIESGKSSLNIEEFSLHELLEVLYTMMLPQAKTRNQNFELRTKGKLPEFIMGDKLRLNQVLLNLLSNSIKYTQEGGNIEVCAERLAQAQPNHARILFTVKDNGFGMSEEFVKTIFEPFSRETTSTTKEIQGTGLGMAITKSIIGMMNGSITVTSKLGEGSAFFVELAFETVSVKEDTQFWKNHKITHMLVVDGEEDVCRDIQLVMKDTGVSVSYALDSAQAFEMVSRTYGTKAAYQVILLAYKMPGMNGIETAARLQADFPENTPILGLSAYDFEEKEDDAKAAGISFFLTKPFFVSGFKRTLAQSFNDEENIDASDNIDLSGLKVLAAEDNEINQEILLELLKIEGIECDIASNGQEALDMFLASKPGQYDMIFMDVHMPVMDGYEASLAIRAGHHKDGRKIPIIAMTADAFEEDVKKALSAGMNAHVAKPIDMNKLKATVAGLRKKK